MNFSEALHRVISFRCLMLRYNPIRYPVGLISIGNPHPESPVLVSGNYFHTVRRLLKRLKGYDCYLLVADSAGINVWCAAGVCDFNEHKIADAVNASGLSEKVSHRKLILPQLGAVGIDLKRLVRECGFRGVWGPASLEDLPAYLDGSESPENMRIVRFPLEDRLYNAIGMFNVFLAIPALFALAGRRREAHFSLLANFLNIFGNFLLYFRLPFRYPSGNSLFLGFVLSLLFLPLKDRKGTSRWLPRPVTRQLILWFVNFLVSIDMLGSTPFFKTTILHWFRTGTAQSLFQPGVTDKCIGCGACVQVCPKGIFSLFSSEASEMTQRSGNRRAYVDLSKECCECLACARQCPVNAISNRGCGFKEDVRSVDRNLIPIVRQ